MPRAYPAEFRARAIALIGVSSSLDDVPAERESVNDSRTQAWVGECLGPRTEAVVRGDGHAVLLFAFG
jgi:hypothetical protein